MNKNWSSLALQLQEIIDDEIRRGNECGCQLCIRHHGRTVIDIAAGYTNASQTEKITADSLFPLFSAGKAVLAALSWRLAEQGFFSFDTPVANFWREFAVPDKAGITIEHLLSHRAGLYLLPSGNPDLADWDEMCRRTAAMPARHAPGSKCHYHPLTFGWLVGHTLELACNKKLPELLASEILSIAGVQDSLFFGITDSAKKIVPVDDTRISQKPSWEARHMNDPKLQRCCIPSFTGIGSARALAEFYSCLRGKIVSPQMFDYATGKVFRAPEDPVKANDWALFALGIMLPGPPENRRMFCGHGGAGGAEAFYMPEEDIAFAFVKNRLSPAHPDHPVRDRISAALEIPKRFW